MGEVPTNWLITELGEVTSKPQYGWTTKSQDFGDYKYLRTTDIGKGNIDWGKVPYCVDLPDTIEKYLLKKDDILISRAGSIGLSFLVDETTEKSLFASYLIRFKPFINPKFISYFLLSSEYWKAISDNAIGIAVKNINAPKLQSIPFPLPPLAEQERIVTKLDALFAQIEKMKLSLAQIPIILKNFRQQVLTQAVTGKLTEKWREGKELEEWKDLDIYDLVLDFKKDVRTGPFGSSLSKSEYQMDGFPVWGIESIGQAGKFTGKNKVFITEEKAKELQSFKVGEGDIIISRSGTVGELCIIPEGINNGFISTNLLKIVLNKSIVNSLFFCWMFKSNPTLLTSLKDLCKGSTRLFITQGILKSLIYQLPTILEQEEIVSIVNKLFIKVDVIEAQYKALKQKIENLPQSILHKAFKGELVAQLPTDGDAKDLLEEIKKLKIKK